MIFKGNTKPAANKHARNNARSHALIPGGRMGKGERHITLGGFCKGTLPNTWGWG